jgi:hypothetical protein
MVLLMNFSLSAQYSNVQIGATLNDWFPDLSRLDCEKNLEYKIIRWFRINKS